MPDYRITMIVKDVARGDIEGVAQSIWDAHARDLDVDRGDFALAVVELIAGNGFDIGWEPYE